MSQTEFYANDYLNASPDTQETGRDDHYHPQEQGGPPLSRVDILELGFRSQGKTLEKVEGTLNEIKRLLGGLGAPSNPDLSSPQVILRPRIADFVMPGATGYSGAPTAFGTMEGTFERDEETPDRGISMENPRELTGGTDRSLVDLSVGSPGFALPSEARPLEELSVAQALLQMRQPHQTIREEETSLQLVGPVSRGVLESMVNRGRGLTPVATQIGGPRHYYKNKEIHWDFLQVKKQVKLSYLKRFIFFINLPSPVVWGGNLFRCKQVCFISLKYLY